MLIGAFILVISFSALIQFAVFTWRAGVLQVASQAPEFEPDSSEALSRNYLNSNSFHDVAAYQNLCPELSAGSAPKLGSVRVYYRLLQALKALGEAMPSAAWAEREMALCTRYAAAVLSQRLVRNQAMLAEVRSY
jgi:CxxC motif-containing protein (DUF1111 family)